MGVDPSSFQALPRSEFNKRRAYWLLWRKSSQPEEVNGVVVENYGIDTDGATIIGD